MNGPNRACLYVDAGVGGGDCEVAVDDWEVECVAVAGAGVVVCVEVAVVDCRVLVESD